MNQKIVKYPFDVTRPFQLIVPLGARILFVNKIKLSGSPPVDETDMWMITDPDMVNQEARNFEAYEANEIFVSDNKIYVGSVIMSNNKPWHVFEILNV